MWWSRPRKSARPWPGCSGRIKARFELRLQVGIQTIQARQDPGLFRLVFYIIMLVDYLHEKVCEHVDVHLAGILFAGSQTSAPLLQGLVLLLHRKPVKEKSEKHNRYG